MKVRKFTDSSDYYKIIELNGGLDGGGKDEGNLI